MSKSGSNRLTPDDVAAAFVQTRTKATVRLLPAEPDDVPYALFEGDRDALEFLGRLFLAQAHSLDCGFQLSPNGAGSRLFGRASDLGIYIHRSDVCSRKPKTSHPSRPG